MKRLAGFAALLLLAGCAAPANAAAPVAPAATTSPAPSGTVKVRPESLLKLPLGTVVDLDSVSVAVLADAGTVKSYRAFKVRLCVSPDYMQTKIAAKYKWFATNAAGKQIDAQQVPGPDAYGGKTVNPGDCSEGLIYFPATSQPSRIWYLTVGTPIGWVTG